MVVLLSCSFIWQMCLYLRQYIQLTIPRVFAGRTPKDSVYAQMIDDLKAAEASGLSWTDGGGRVSLGAVKSLLAEVYLTMAGYPMDKKEYF